MALDTTIGGAAADSYATLAEYTARAAAMGWTLAETDAANEINLRRAVVAMDATYSFRGTKNTLAQAREWPRYDVSGYGSAMWFDPYQITPEVIPPAVKDAQMELAYLIQGGADPLATTSGNIKAEQLGPMRREYGSPKSALSRFTAVDRILKPYLAGGIGQARAARA